MSHYNEDGHRVNVPTLAANGENFNVWSIRVRAMLEDMNAISAFSFPIYSSEEKEDDVTIENVFTNPRSAPAALDLETQVFDEWKEGLKNVDLKLRAKVFSKLIERVLDSHLMLCIDKPQDPVFIWSLLQTKFAPTGQITAAKLQVTFHGSTIEEHLAKQNPFGSFVSELNNLRFRISQTGGQTPSDASMLAQLIVGLSKAQEYKSLATILSVSVADGASYSEALVRCKTALELNPVSVSTPQFVGSARSNERRKVCFAFAQGRCSRNNCRFLHERSPEAKSRAEEYLAKRKQFCVVCNTTVSHRTADVPNSSIFVL